MNKLYKRALVSVGLTMLYSYATVQFLYESRIACKTTIPIYLFEKLPYVIYTVPLVVLIGYVIRENGRVLNRLDSKYTPIWVKYTEEQALLK